jgi:hypothetical protein
MHNNFLFSDSQKREAPKRDEEFSMEADNCWPIFTSPFLPIPISIRRIFDRYSSSDKATVVTDELGVGRAEEEFFNTSKSTSY